MPVRRDMIIECPRWTRPAIAGPGGTFEAVVPAEYGWPTEAFLLDATGKRLACPGPTRTGRHNAFLHLDLTAPTDLAPGLYDLLLRLRPGVEVHEPHCVWAPGHERKTFTFAHISDLHIMSPDKVRPRDQADRMRRLMQHLRNEVRPEFILNTGDIISRYGSGGAPLPPADMRRQMRDARAILLTTRIPHFLTPGNHDIAFPSIESEWHRCMGGFWVDGRNDYAFTYRGCRFIALDRSLGYDERHRIIERGIAPGQRTWLTTELEASHTAMRTFLFCHYDYGNDLLPALATHAIDRVLYGHSDTSCVPAELQDHDAQLLSRYAYQTITVTATGIRRDPGWAWDDL